MAYWVVLSTKWALEDLQAGLAIVIQVVCVFGMFIASHTLWQLHALHVARGRRVPIARVLSINSPGEVWDAIWLLRYRIFTYHSTVLQCLIVVLLGVVTLFSGPIARFASHRGTTLPETTLSGRLASRTTTCIRDDVVGVQRIWDRLDKAKYPKNQLLDFLPDLSADWQYVEKDWNSSWTTDCQYTNTTKIQLTGTGVRNGTESWPDIYFQFNDLWDLTPSLRSNWTYIKTANQGTIKNGTFEDVTLWMNVVKLSEPMRMALVVVYMDQPPSKLGDDGVVFSTGPAPATYAKVECTLHQRVKTQFQARPDLVFDDTCVVENLKGYFFQRVLERGLDGVGGQLPKGEDIFRWFQAYMISKDIKTLMPVSRLVSVRVGTVEVAGWFFGTISVTVAIVLVGLARYVYVWWRYRDLLSKIPETKADWVLRSGGGKDLETLYGMGVGTWLEMGGEHLNRGRRQYAKLPDEEGEMRM